MLIAQKYLKGDMLVLRDADGSEVELTLDDAIDLLIWLRMNMAEMERRNLEKHLRECDPDEWLHEG